MKKQTRKQATTTQRIIIFTLIKTSHTIYELNSKRTSSQQQQQRLKTRATLETSVFSLSIYISTTILLLPLSRCMYVMAILHESSSILSLFIYAKEHQLCARFAV